MKALLLILLLLALPATHAAELAGRLFFTPQQRVQLDQLRTQKAVASQVREEPIPETVTYNGIIRRSDGKTTIWMNNQPMSAAELRSGQAVTGTVSRDGRILLQNPQAGTGGRLELKVGQSATLLSGKVDESFSSQRAAPEKSKAADPKAATEATKPAPAPGAGPERPSAGIPEPVSR
ncbi:MAG: hypothetical protein Q8L65_15300 [Burkholderiales bacterium]|jgi:hypothetical protein|nr:hypothetical protein [Burkholderiales bacterium]MDP2399191.1 hypothetical protein [Burkholderiales bacterium]